MSRKRVPLNQNECTADFRIGVPFEQNLQFSKNYREMPEGEFVKSVLDEMKLWMFIRKEELAHQIKICPLTGKIQGSYPEDYMGGRNDE